MTEASPDRLKEQIKQGDDEALASLFTRYRAQMRRLVSHRMDPRLARRVDASDVVQQSFIEARNRIKHYINHSSMPFSLWMRQVTLQTLVEVHRKHFGVQKRDLSQEVALDRANSSYSTLADRLVSSLASPSSMAVRQERLVRLREAIDGMDEIDREILVLRHFEELGNKEVAELLEIGQPAASNRYIRALKRLGDILADEDETD